MSTLRTLVVFSINPQLFINKIIHSFILLTAEYRSPPFSALFAWPARFATTQSFPLYLPNLFALGNF